MPHATSLLSSLFNASLDCMPKHQLQKFIACLKMSNNNEYTYYTITLLKYHAFSRRPCVKIDGHFSVLEAEKPEPPDGMKYIRRSS